jgi:indolepyruvate ferredoxin oxidoreductase, alpha subunit
MASLMEQIISPEPWREMLIGNYAVARAMIDTNTKVITTFPGSPTPEIAALLDRIPKEKRDYYFEYSTNEKVALEVAVGASVNGHLSTVFFKSVGLNVAADSLIQLGLMNLIGGIVIILGDDPGANSSQNEQDNRVFSRMSYIPMFEPATPQETYDMYHEAARLSREHQMPVFLRMTTHVCHAREVVSVKAIPATTDDWTPKFDAANGPYLPIGELVFPLKRSALNKLTRFEEHGNSTEANQLLAPNGNEKVDGKTLGIISSGIPALALMENLFETRQPIEILKLGLTYPLPKQKIRDFLASHDEVLIVEELDPVLEQEIKTIAWDAEAKCRIYARPDIEYMMGELVPHRTQSLLADTWPNLFKKPAPVDTGEDVAPRIPQMCPGCGHRSAFHAVKTALGENDITVADIGCHSLGFMTPYNMGEFLLCMGHSVPTGSGLAINNDSRKVVTFIGDSTLIHAGMPGIVNAAVYDHNLTLILMENGTTAMTGHQPRFGSGEVGETLPLQDLLRGLGVKHILEVDAYKQEPLREKLRECMDHKGFSVLIAGHACMLKFTRELKKKRPDYKPNPVEVNQETCNRAMTCLREFACPSFQLEEDGSITVSKDLCIGDGSCIQTCAVKAIGRFPRKGGAK